MSFVSSWNWAIPPDNEQSASQIEFEIEKPEVTPDGLSLLLLDFKVVISKDGKSSFEFYKKKIS